MKHFDSLQEFHEYMEWPSPEHPLLSLVSLDTGEVPHRKSSPPITNDCYMIVLKQVVSGEMNYGRTKLDFSRGVMLFFAPGQSIGWQEVDVSQTGFMINIHKDYFRRYALAERIKTYGYFSYAVNEALHLSPKEEVTVTSIYKNILAEYHNNQDELSKEIIIGLLDTLLKYADRFYKRQFMNRKEINSDLGFQFQQALIRYFESGRFKESGTPNIDWVASELAVTPRYLSDALKAETGKTAMEHLHLYLIDEAKNLLLEPGKTVAEVAYQLGYEYPQYFSRLFKKKVGISPKKFQEDRAIH